MEQATGIGPATNAWEAFILPLNYACKLYKYNITSFSNFKSYKANIYKKFVIYLKREVFMTKFINKKSCFIGKNVRLGQNVTIYENNHLDGNVEIGDNVTLLPNNYIINSKIGKNCTVQSSVIEECEIEEDTTVGPFARLRPKSFVGKNCKLGNFVEIKNSKVGNGCKISHLAYVGDCEMGENCNIGCGVIFANYDGRAKHKTTIGNHVFIGSNSNIIAPVKIGDDSYICAGTTVTDKVKNGDFVIGRARQENKPNRAKKYW